MNKQDNLTASADQAAHGDQTASADRTAQDDRRNAVESNSEFQEHMVHDAMTEREERIQQPDLVQRDARDTQSDGAAASITGDTADGQDVAGTENDATAPISPTTPDSPDSSSDAVTDNQADAANTIPLYATTPPPQSAAEAATAGGDQASQGARQDNSAYASGGYGTAGGYGADDPGTGKPYSQPYVYVPPQSAQPGQLLHKTGPSAPTIIFGALMLFAGVITLLFGLRFPNMILPQLRADPRVFVAVICAVAGLILVAVAVAWSLSKLIHGIRRKRRSGDGSTDRPTDAPDPASYDVSDHAAYGAPGTARDLHPSDETDQRTDVNMDEYAPTEQGRQTRATGQTRAQ